MLTRNYIKQLTGNGNVAPRKVSQHCYVLCTWLIEVHAIASVCWVDIIQYAFYQETTWQRRAVQVKPSFPTRRRRVLFGARKLRATHRTCIKYQQSTIYANKKYCFPRFGLIEKCHHHTVEWGMKRPSRNISVGLIEFPSSGENTDWNATARSALIQPRMEQIQHRFSNTHAIYVVDGCSRIATAKHKFFSVCCQLGYDSAPSVIGSGLFSIEATGFAAVFAG